ncbi:M24 family metallopeptidase [Bacillus salacetis]|uniref:M24 family metallopeptidase n=1 Tax=Bacillus salacetis TaxID=2315464 RepID=A0A3A1R4G1_9BACI|nr:M24 family metallopeptidase [Bacillus salacetis]RIW37247.1 M24 family metallopeptidase [Bacillus salacetis]
MDNKFFSKVLPLKDRERFADRVLKERLETILPMLMEDHGIDMWILIGREYNEDPVIGTFFPAAVDSSRRLTMLIFHKLEGGGVERLVIHPDPAFQPYYQNALNDTDETQWECAARIIQKERPDQVAVNAGGMHAVCDGLTVGLFEKLQEEIGRDCKLVSSEPLLTDWLQIRSPLELTAYPHICELAREIGQHALSNKVVHPGVTSVKEVVDWIRQTVLDMGLKTSFYPTVDIQREGAEADRLVDTVILPGDIVHLDFGIHYLGLATDTQQLAYVLKSGESKAPESLSSAFGKALRFEDIVTETFQEGKSGNQVFTESIRNAKKEKIEAMLYSHPLGVHCHGAGPLVGLYDKQQEIQGRGEISIRNNTCYALEFNIRAFIPEWNHDIPIYLEEPISFSNGKARYMARRQKEFYLIK